MAFKVLTSIHAPLRRFLYEGRLKGSAAEGFDGSLDSACSRLAKKLSTQVKLEREPWVADVGGGEADCTVVEELSTPVKRVAECVIVGEVTAEEKAESKKRKKNYDSRRHFQDSWAAKLPWAEAVVGCDGSITQVRCKICSDVEVREKLLVPKIDSLYKHAGRRKAMVDIGKVRRGEYFYLGTNQHVKNERVFFVKGGQAVITQVLAGVTKERWRKIVQMRCCLHVLQQGRPMADYQAIGELLMLLMVPELPKKHWGQPAGWDFAQAMSRVCADRLKRGIAKAPFIFASADEVTAGDNTQWLSVHVYYSVNFICESHMICIRPVDCDANAKNLTEMIVTQLQYHGGLGDDDLAQKLVCFGANGAAVFQGSCSRVIQRFTAHHAPYVVGVHDFAHRTNLASEALSGLSNHSLIMLALITRGKLRRGMGLNCELFCLHNICKFMLVVYMSFSHSCVN